MDTDAAQPEQERGEKVFRVKGGLINKRGPVKLWGREHNSWDIMLQNTSVYPGEAFWNAVSLKHEERFYILPHLLLFQVIYVSVSL